MDPLTMMLLSQIIPAAVKGVKAIQQGKQARELAKTPRPKYEIPQEVMQQLNQAKYMAGMSELPGQNLLEGRIGANINKGVSELERVSATPSNLSSNVAKLYMGGNDQINDIGMAASQQWLRNQGMLSNVLGNVGTYRDKEFDYNMNQPYQNNMAAASALREGSYRNVQSASQDLASGLSGYANMDYYDNLLKDINKTGTTTNPYLPENKTYKDEFKTLKTVDEKGPGVYKPKNTKQDINRFRIQTSEPKLFGQ